VCIELAGTQCGEPCEVAEDADDFFSRVLHNKNHVLYPLNPNETTMVMNCDADAMNVCQQQTGVSAVRRVGLLLRPPSTHVSSRRATHTARHVDIQLPSDMQDRHRVLPRHPARGCMTARRRTPTSTPSSSIVRYSVYWTHTRRC